MKLSNFALFSASALQLIAILLVLETPVTSVAQDPAFELPVQIVGFPVIILSVRIANFLKRLAYSLDPSTYRRQSTVSRTKRKTVESNNLKDKLDAIQAEEQLIEEFGPNVCIYERICAYYAAKTQRTRTKNIDWETVLSTYKRSPDKNKEFYLLSVFMGDIVGSPNLCHQLARRGRACAPLGGWQQR